MQPQNERYRRDAAKEHAASQGTGRAEGGCACSCNEIERRVLLKTIGLGVALARPIAALAGEAGKEGANVSHHVQADKRLTAELIQKLRSRGSKEAFRGKDNETVGMPVGGIATGQLYLRGDGTLACWQIMNHQHPTGVGQANYKRLLPESPVDQGFAAVIKEGDTETTMKLNRDYFPDVEFIGEYPIGRVRYERSDCPVRIELEAFSPFIPLNAKDSALPATHLSFTVENTSDRRLKVGMRAWLGNAVLLHTGPELPAVRRNRLIREQGRTFVVCTAEKDSSSDAEPQRPPVVLADFEGNNYGEWKATGKAFGEGPAKGTLPNQNPVSGFEGTGLVNTYLGGDESTGTLTSPAFTISRRYINMLVGGGQHANETCVNLLVDGKVVRTAVGKNDEKLTWRSWRVAGFEGKQAQIQIVDNASGGWGHVNVDQIELADTRRLGPTGKIEEQHDYGSMVLACEGGASAGSGLGGDEGRTCSTDEPLSATMQTDAVELKAGAKHTFRFVIAWHFPRCEHGHEYASRFDSALAVARYNLDNLGRLAGDTRKWRDTFYDSTLPYWLLDRIGSTVSNLATGTCQWWADGRFWAWEGVYCCHGTCTHVWNYAHALARLFPELERSAREMQDLGVALHPDGLVGFRGERNGHYAADGQAGTVLKCYREHQMSADDSFLRRNWHKIEKVLEYSIHHDGDENGLIEDSQHNTYDINFVGPNTMVGALYLAALRAGEEMAREVGDAPFADRARRIFESGRRQSEQMLWNGEYFIQVVDLEQHPKHQYGLGCLSDQLFGQGWAWQVGLGSLYEPDKVRKALTSIWKYNWAPDIEPQNKAHAPWRWFADNGEAGLFICTWPHSPHLPEGVLYQNEVWTGTEYQVAGHMIWEGMIDEGLRMIHAIHERYHPAKRNPYNEVECGDHYARALASWGPFTALSGYEYHGPKGRLAFAPRLTPEDFRSAFTAAEGWGTFEQKRAGNRQTNAITPRWGSLHLRELVLAVPDNLSASTVKVTLAGAPVEAKTGMKGGRLTVAFPKGVTVQAGQTLSTTVG